MTRVSKKIVKMIALGELARALKVATEGVDDALAALSILAEEGFQDLDGVTDAWNQLQNAGLALLRADAAIAAGGGDFYAQRCQAAANPIPIPARVASARRRC
jgi:hypothetical protein